MAEISVQENPAMQVPLPVISNHKREVDGSYNPTRLFNLINRQQWAGAEEFLRDEPIEASIWIFSGKERRWEYLPLHIVCLNWRKGNPTSDNPETLSLIDELLRAYPEGAQFPDHEGKYAFHLALQSGAPVKVLSSLFFAFPAVVNIPDNDGNTPLKHILSGSDNGIGLEFLKMLTTSSFEFKTKYNDIMRENEAMKFDLNETRDELSEFRGETIRLSQLNASMKRQLSTTEQSIEKKSNVPKAREEEISVREEKDSPEVREQSEAPSASQAHAAKLETLNSIINSLKKKLSTIQGEYDTKLSEQEADFTNTLTSMKNEHKVNMVQMLGQLKNSYENEKEYYENALNSVMEERDSSKQELKDALTKKESLEERLDTAETKLKVDAKEKIKSQNTLKVLQKQLLSLKKAQIDAKLNIDKLKLENEELKERNASLESQVIYDGESKEIIAKLENENTLAIKANQSYALQNEALQERCSILKSEMLVFKCGNIALNGKNSALGSVEQMVKANVELQASSSKYHDELVETKENLIELQEVSEKRQDELVEAKKTILQLNAKVNKLEDAQKTSAESDEVIDRLKSELIDSKKSKMESDKVHEANIQKLKKLHQTTLKIFQEGQKANEKKIRKDQSGSSALKEENVSLKTILAETESQLHICKEEKALLEENVTKLETAERKRKTLELLLKKSNSRVDELNDTLDELRKENEVLTNDNKEMVHLLNQADTYKDAEKAARLTSIKGLEKCKNDAEIKISLLNEQLLKKSEEHDEKIKQYITKETSLTLKGQQLQDKLTKSLQEISDLKALFVDKEEDMKNIKASANTVTKDLLKKISVYDETIKVQKQKIDYLTANKDSTDSSTSKLQEKLQEKLHDTKSQLDQAHKRLEELETNLKNQTAIASELENASEKTERSRKTIDHMLKASNSRVDELNNKVKILQDQNEELSQKHSNVEKLLADLQKHTDSERAALFKSLKTLEKGKTDNTTQMSSFQKTLDRMKQQNKVLKREMEVSAKEKLELEQKNKCLHESINQVKTKANAERDSLMKINYSLEKNHEMAITMISTTEKRIAKLKAENKELLASVKR